MVMASGASEDFKNEMTIKEFADEIGVTYITAMKYIHKGLVAAVRRGGRWWIAVEECERFKREGNLRNIDRGSRDE